MLLDGRRVLPLFLRHGFLRSLRESLVEWIINLFYFRLCFLQNAVKVLFLFFAIQLESMYPQLLKNVFALLFFWKKVKSQRLYVALGRVR